MIMKLFQLLNSPLPVAYFQYFCGIRWRYPNRKNPVFPITQTQDSSNLSREEKKNQRNYVILNRFLFVLAKAGTELAGEPFYYIFFPACAWVFPLNVARRTFLMLSTSMFIGQGLKVSLSYELLLLKTDFKDHLFVYLQIFFLFSKK